MSDIVLQFQEEQGPSGPPGAGSAVTFKWDAGTDDADPGNGEFKLNQAAFASATAAYVDDLNSAGGSIAEWIDSFDNSGQTANRGTLTLQKVGAEENFAIYIVTGSVVDGSGYRKLALTHIASDGAFAAGDEIAASFSVAATVGAALSQIDALTPSNDDLLQRKAGAWTNRTLAQVKSDLALNNVDNTSDANKPVSTAQQTALNLKANSASPALTGTVTIPTPAAGDNSTKAASTAYVAGALADRTFLSIAGLRAFATASLATTAFVIGWNALTLYGGGNFYYDATDTTTADNGGTVIVDAANRRWKRVFPQADVVTPEMFGALRDGTSDSYAAINAALAYLNTVGGGVVDGGAYTYKSLSAFVLPNDGASPPRQKPFKFRGVGSFWSGQGGAITGSTVFDLRSADANGKIQTYGVGRFASEGITYTDIGGATSNPFIYTTNTTLDIAENSFIGSKTTTACDQDAIVCGGITTTIDGTAAAPFQGYGTVIQRNYFNKIRRAVYGRVYFNGAIIRDNTLWSSCGSNLAGGAAFELDGLSGAGNATANLLSGNLIEGFGYVYGIKLGYAAKNALIANTIFDTTSTMLYGVLFSANASDNFLLTTITKAGLSNSDLGARNVIIDLEQNLSSKFVKLLTTDYFEARGGTILSGNGVSSRHVVVQPAASQVDGSMLLQMLRSAAEGSNPSGNIFKWSQDGSFSAFSSAGAEVAWTNSGRKWACVGSGGNMEQNSGSGGSFFDTKNFAHRDYDHTGALRSKFYSNVGGLSAIGWELGPSADTFLYRHASVAALATNRPFNLGTFTVATLPTPSANYKPGVAFASDGRKSGEGAAAGTGCPVWCDSSNWKTFYDNSTVAA